jgi:hypothetical protein
MFVTDLDEFDQHSIRTRHTVNFFGVLYDCQIIKHVGNLFIVIVRVEHAKTLWVLYAAVAIDGLVYEYVLTLHEPEPVENFLFAFEIANNLELGLHVRGVHVTLNVRGVTPIGHLFAFTYREPIPHVSRNFVRRDRPDLVPLGFDSWDSFPYFTSFTRFEILKRDSTLFDVSIKKLARHLVRLARENLNLVPVLEEVPDHTARHDLVADAQMNYETNPLHLYP